MNRNSDTTDFKEAPLLAHLEELRLRLIYAVLFWALGSGVAWMYHNQLFKLLKAPFNSFIATGGKGEIIALRLTDQLTTALQISLFGGIVLALPFIVYQVWAFVAPGLTKSERRWGGPFILGVGLSFGLGVAFAYYVILPYAVQFLLGGGFLEGVATQLTIADYIGDILMYLGIFGLVFELPITMYLLSKIGLVNPKFLSSIRRYAIFAIFAASAILTPTTDLVNMSMMAVPLVVLYEIGILLSGVAVRQNARARKVIEVSNSTDDFEDA
jgi:sec-independent protein translocase protein TatC